MSFYSYKNKGNERSPGLADFEALKCITERVCVQVNKVYDSCLEQGSLPSVSMTLANVSGTAPHTFVSLKNSVTEGSLQNYSITRLPDRPNFARVQTDVNIPLNVTHIDSKGVEYVATTSTTVHKDVIMYVPDESIIPYSLESQVGAVSVVGSITTDDDEVSTLVADVCFSVVLKIVAQVELLIPSFGFCELPPCEEYAEEACDDFFSLPLFPPQMEDVLSNNTALGSSFYNSKIDK